MNKNTCEHLNLIPMYFTYFATVIWDTFIKKNFCKYKKEIYSLAALWGTFIKKIFLQNYIKKIYSLAAVWDIFIKKFSCKYKKEFSHKYKKKNFLQI